MNENYKKILHRINTFVFDVDGVLTDGTVTVTNNGALLRTMNVKDGYALKTAVKTGYRIAIITGGVNQGVQKRLQDLGITDIYMGAHQKTEPLQDFLSRYGIPADEVAYMGDDLPDVLPMQLVGLAACPQDAVQEVKAIAQYVSHKKGGRGAARDLIEQVLKLHKHWNKNFSAAND